MDKKTRNSSISMLFGNMEVHSRKHLEDLSVVTSRE